MYADSVTGLAWASLTVRTRPNHSRGPPAGFRFVMPCLSSILGKRGARDIGSCMAYRSYAGGSRQDKSSLTSNATFQPCSARLCAVGRSPYRTHRATCGGIYGTRWRWAWRSIAGLLLLLLRCRRSPGRRQSVPPRPETTSNKNPPGGDLRPDMSWQHAPCCNAMCIPSFTSSWRGLPCRCRLIRTPPARALPVGREENLKNNGWHMCVGWN